MQKTLWTAMLAVCATVLVGGLIFARGASGQFDPTVPAPPAPPAAPSRLVVLWTSGEPDVAHQVCFMYTHAAHRSKWFDEVRLVVWGPSSRLLAGDKELQKKIKAMMDDGMKVQACVVCANNYGVADRLREMGLEVKGMGKPLSDYMHDGWKVLTF